MHPVPRFYPFSHEDIINGTFKNTPDIKTWRRHDRVNIELEL
jgi:hypothetical protein